MMHFVLSYQGGHMLGENVKDVIYMNLAKEFIYQIQLAAPMLFELDAMEMIYQEFEHTVVDFGGDVSLDMQWNRKVVKDAR